jgi:hypothetical protein
MYIGRRENDMASDRDRVISISLSEAEWRAFVAQHPQPVTWIQDRIREQLRASVIESDEPGAELRAVN